ncbi:MAG: (Fe-S)-binding protein [Alistipes sp.]|nr:(Fe-S)-binding protein [Alistipes sp.]
MVFYADFCLPFIAGAAVMFAAVVIKYTVWLVQLPAADKRLILKGLPTRRTLDAVVETVRESLLHRRIFRVNPVLGYMHMSLAFGWFLLIVTGWIETMAYVGLHWVPLQGHVFFKYFMPANGIADHKPWFDFVMDLLLLFVLSGVALAWFKRMRSRALGMRRTTRHIIFDRVALTSLWFVFPARLAAESITCALWGGGSFLTAGTGSLLSGVFGRAALEAAYQPVWWFYSCALGVFFAAMPFSRYMHIFTEVPLIFLRAYRVRPESAAKSYDNFEIQACSRCGICIDPCQLQSSLGIDEVQSVYFLRDRRYRMLQHKVADNCLMCGRCEQVCPVGINLNTLRLNARSSSRDRCDESRYAYLSGIDRSSGEGRTGYFAGCMTRLTPRTMESMARIFDAAGEQVWWADREGGVCCGRPLKLSGEVEAARRMVESNSELFRRHGITTLVTSCPICLREFRETYRLDGVEILHHSEYILRLIRAGRLHLRRDAGALYTYHDPCELGRGCGIYDEPRAVIESVGRLVEPAHTRENALCCGSSLANTVIDDPCQLTIARDVARELEATAAGSVVTACPQCKKALSRGTTCQVADLSEIVAASL